MLLLLIWWLPSSFLVNAVGYVSKYIETDTERERERQREAEREREKSPGGCGSAYCIMFASYVFCCWRVKHCRNSAKKQLTSWKSTLPGSPVFVLVYVYTHLTLISSVSPSTQKGPKLSPKGLRIHVLTVIFGINVVPISAWWGPSISSMVSWTLGEGFIVSIPISDCMSLNALDSRWAMGFRALHFWSF